MIKTKHLSVLFTVAVILTLLTGCGNHGVARLPDTEETTSPIALLPKSEPDAQFSFADLSQLEFHFGNVANASGTVLTIQDDGTFEGEYKAIVAQDSAYPGGVIALCSFKGKLTQPVQVNDYTYSITLTQLELAQEPGAEAVKDGSRLLYSEPSGLDDAEELLFYLPGAPVKDLPEDYQYWMTGYVDPLDSTLPFYGLYNVNGYEGFFSQKKAEITNTEKAAQSAFSGLLSGDSSLLEDIQEYIFSLTSGELEYTTLDLDGDGISELLVQWAGDPCSYNAVYHYVDGKMVCWNNDMMEMSCRDYPLQDGTMVRQYDYSGTRSYTLFQYESDGGQEALSRLFARDELVYDDGQTPCPYYEVDGEEVDEVTFNAELAQRVTGQLLERSAWTAIDFSP